MALHTPARLVFDGQRLDRNVAATSMEKQKAIATDGQVLEATGS